MMKFFAIAALAVAVALPASAQTEPNPGPGLGNLSYTSGELFSEISRIHPGDGGALGVGTNYGYNLAHMVNGYMVTVFAEDGGGVRGDVRGGIQFYDVSNPRSPRIVKKVWDPTGTTARMREIHAMCFGVVDGRQLMLLPSLKGIQIWDVTDVNAPSRVSLFEFVNGGDYTDTPWQLMWQHPYVYVATGGNGLYLIDVSDPANPSLATRASGGPNPIPNGQLGGFNIGPTWVLGNRLIVSSMESRSGFSVLDVGAPTEPQLLDSVASIPEHHYSPGFTGSRMAFATRQSNARTPIYRIDADGSIVLESHAASPVVAEQLYTASQDHYVFLGCQAEVVKLDISDPTAPFIAGRGGLNAVSNPDFGQANPFGNVILIGNDHGTGTGFMPHQQAPDTAPPVVDATSPADGELDVSRCARVGIAFSDNVELTTLTPQNIKVQPLVEGVPGDPLDGVFTLQFGLVNFTPAEEFAANTTYLVTVVADGVADWSGNAIAADYQFAFRTGSQCGTPPVIVDPDGEMHRWSFNGDANDSVGALDGSLQGGASLSGGRLQVNGSDSFLQLNGTLDALQGSGSLAFYLSTNQAGSNSPWLAPGVTGIELAGSQADVFWGWINGSGRLCVSAGDGGVTETSIAVNDGEARHFVITRNATTGAQQIFINGELDASGTGRTGTAGQGFSSLGRIEDNGGSPVDLVGTLDEVRVFNYPLTTTEAETVYSQAQTSSLLHDWPLTGDLVDAVGGLDGSANGSPVHAEGGLRFDGVDDVVVLGGGVQAGDWTVSLFAKRSSDADEQVLLSGGGAELHLSHPGTGNGIGFTTAGGQSFSWDVAAPLNDWAHLVFVRDGGAVTLFVDGVSYGASPVALDLPLELLGAAGTIGGSSSANVASANVPQNINSNQTVTSTLEVTGAGGTLTDVNVRVDATHTYTGDLDVFLIHPDGTRVELTTDNGGTGENFTETWFDDEAAQAITEGSAPFTGSFQPEGSLVTLDGKSANGTWTLEVTDDASNDEGELIGWHVQWTTNGGAPDLNGFAAAVIDDVRVYGAALDGDGVASLRNGLAASATPPAATTLGEATSFTGSAHSAAGDVRFVWDFGDGATSAESSDAAVTHTYDEPGHYTVRMIASDRLGERIVSFTHTVVRAATAGRPVRSGTIAVAGGKAYCVNIDNDSITAVNGEFPYNRLWEAPAGTHPRSIAVAGDGNLWVTNKESASVTVHHASTGGVIATYELPFASRPHGLVIAPDQSAAYVSLEATGQIARLNLATGAVEQLGDVGAWPRGLAMTHDASRLLVTRFISEDSGAVVQEVNPATLAVVRTFTLAPDTTTVDDSFQARGIGNYLNTVTISPDGTTAWVPSKKDNIFGGTGRDGQPLAFDTSVRPICSTLDLAGNGSAMRQIIDFNDVGLPVDVEFSPNGGYAFVALEGSNQVEIRDAFSGDRRGGVDNSGLTPRGLALSSDGGALFVHHFLDRSIKIFDASDVRDGTGFALREVGYIKTVTTEALAPQVLAGKKVFYNAGDARMAKDAYISCASCHDDGGHDGRTWDFTQRGEGFRNTTTLRGRSGMAHGRVHWTGNFDEIQDFEHDIRNAFGGTGFLSDAQFNSGTRNTPLGDPKAGLSAELDAMAAYVASLDDVPESPHKSADGEMTEAAVRGREAFLSLGCYHCHDTDIFTDSAATGTLHDVGTLTSLSGSRLGVRITGLDTPSLLGVWHTAPYLHDGSAATLLDVITTRNSGDNHGAVSSLTAQQKADLVAYLQQLDGAEKAAPGYDRWKHEQLTLDEVLGGALVLRSADDDQDGRDNFFEYVFGTDPTSADGSAVTAVSRNADGTMDLVFEITDGAEAEAAIQCQSSPTLAAADWQDVETNEVTRTRIGNRLRITLRLPSPAAGNNRQFFRLRATERSQ
ncbi:LamG-like jellyroll fold domain-containing protein [Sulfuriroseicoccus oceanibius]|uniref:Ig-like domain-containing protein n=1 Tax=Sulfuriroseicoccus oceanibius TaxID=2707525 RepID=A0A6B3LAD3_9BACT|nr:LamG-like jellyroll fold domain-containing protein [Sulfuriroseicoccus oceanibius]QQL45260.1 Ig-like domain-containing protein [Sulfuriroseicoccus oceanibius]